MEHESAFFGIAAVVLLYMLPGLGIVCLVSALMKNQKLKYGRVGLICAAVLSIVPTVYLLITDAFSYCSAVAVVCPAVLLKYGPLFLLVFFGVTLLILKIAGRIFSLRRFLIVFAVAEAVSVITTVLYWILK